MAKCPHVLLIRQILYKSKGPNAKILMSFIRKYDDDGDDGDDGDDDDDYDDDDDDGEDADEASPWLENYMWWRAEAERQLPLR